MIEARSRAGARLVGVAEEIGKVARRIRVNRRVKHVRALVENILGAVAMVVIDIENCHASGAVVPQALRGDRRVVQETVTAVVVACCVVTRRPAQAERGSFPALRDADGAGRGNVRGRPGGFPRSRGDG